VPVKSWSAPRSLKSFGIGGILKNGCTVFYHHLFNSVHFGRVTDLISARVRDSQVDEMKLRAISLYAFFEAYQALLGKEGSVDDQGTVGEPISIECGLDDEKIGVSVSLLVDAEFKFKEVLDRIKGGSASSALERTIWNLSSVAEKTYVKFHAESLRVEISSLVSLPLDHAPAEKGQVSEQRIEGVELEKELEDTPTVGEYAELGDLNASELLQDEKGRKLGQTSGLKEEAGDLELKKLDSAPKKKGVWGLFGGKDKENTEGADSAEDTKELKKKLADAEKQIEKLKSEASRKTSGGGLFGGIFAKKDSAEGAADGQKASTGGASGKRWTNFKVIEEAVQSDWGKNSKAGKSMMGSPDLGIFEMADELNKVVLAKGFYDAAKTFHSKLESLDGEISSAEVWDTIQEFLKQLIYQKHEIGELVQGILKKSRESTASNVGEEKKLREELRRQEEVVRNKGIAMDKLKTEIEVLKQNVERMKAEARSAMADAQYKKKYIHLERMLNASKDESSKLRAKVDDLTKQNTNIKNAQKAGGDPVELKAEVTKLKGEVVALSSQNKDLTSKLNRSDMEIKPLKRQVDDMKKKLAEASKLLGDKKKELDQAKAKMITLEREHALAKANGGKKGAA